MSDETVQRRLTCVLYADVVGYSRLTGDDEVGTHRAVMDSLDLARDTIESHDGRVLRYAGDAILAQFDSVVSCVSAAVGLQSALHERSTSLAEARRVRLRIGINLGEVIEDRGEIYGEGVNVAARLESIAPPAGICITAQVAEEIAGKLEVDFADAGVHSLKNITKPVSVWCWPASAAAAIRPRSPRRWHVPAAAIAVLLTAFIVYTVKYADQSSMLPSGPKLAVIPFDEIGTPSDKAYFSDGLTKDVNAYLSKFTNLFVLAPSAVSSFRGGAPCETIRDEVGADYILEGSVRRTGSKLRVTTTLIDAKTCRQLDAPGPYDRNLDVSDLLDIQLDIAKKVAAQVGSADAPLLNASIQGAIRNKAPDSLQTYDCVLLSYWFYENFDPERHRRARHCLEKAVMPDADYSLGWSRLAFSYIESKKYAIDTPADWPERAREAANHAIDIDPDNPDAYYALAILTQMTSQDLTEFTTFANKAIELNPNDAFVLADLGTWMGYAGQWETAKHWVARSIELNPKHQSWLYQTWHLHHFLEGDYAKSRDMALKMNLPGNYMVQASLTAAYAMNGEQKKAQQTLARVLELRPDYGKDPRAPFRARGMPSALIEGLMDGLRKAGLDVPPAS